MARMFFFFPQRQATLIPIKGNSSENIRVCDRHVHDVSDSRSLYTNVVTVPGRTLSYVKHLSPSPREGQQKYYDKKKRFHHPVREYSKLIELIG